MRNFLACAGGFILGFLVAGFLITDELDSQRNRNIHLDYEVARLKRQLNPPHFS